MAIGKKTGGRDFKPGHPGKPKGAKDKAPRGLLRALVMEAMEQGEPAVRAMIQRCLLKPGPFLKLLELAAKLNKEIGAAAAAQAPGFTLIFESPLNLDEIRRSVQDHDRALQPPQ